jgi:hypothetical protein
MATLISSNHYPDAHQQQDGSRYVTEVHVDSEGKSYQYVYACPVNVNAQDVMEQRALLISEQLAAKERAVMLVQGTLVPFTKLEFRMCFTYQERKILDRFHKEFENSLLLSDEQKDDIRTGLEDYKVAEDIARPFNEQVTQMLETYVALGFLTSARMLEIKAIGNGN